MSPCPIYEYKTHHLGVKCLKLKLSVDQSAWNHHKRLSWYDVKPPPIKVVDLNQPISFKTVGYFCSVVLFSAFFDPSACGISGGNHG
ncbi:hypothetical protein CEXT_224051 [Caerostris extrusa]|uniref:Uncharacterized protein n=1 Tax=Caerostris extrusa TaxID=172846 RepID=A0AAV4N9H1_CAEEX|nr:hypothetical protein CEXT_224051 [Caerostris extrusa]